MNHEETWLQRNRIYLWGIAVVLVVLYIIAFLVTPTETPVDYSGAVTAYSVQDEAWEETRQVELHGTLTQYVIGKDSFSGTLSVSDTPGLDGEMALSLTRTKGRWEGSFHTDAGEPVTTGVYAVGADKDFGNIAIAFFTSYEKTGNTVQASFTADEASFLAPDAVNRYAALTRFREYWGGTQTAAEN
jgi:hypothetical protein